ncbi:hypothetical protein SteCoe_19777 [Stentor coeruleus]|uniref:FCP1 homology domain-containing protein n=1 Tax=Stentor coeruleus TaxID=5963 RepID=A0A1R2BTA2_9CILI|nr:hypothetical protein SteCoe_19777 [Stentor coeruleus]
MQDSSDSIIEDDSKNSVVLSESPILNIIQQSDSNGQQLPLKIVKQSWISYFCECFRISNISAFQKAPNNLIEPQLPKFIGKNTLVLDLDETLVHSSFTSLPCDINFSLFLEDQEYNIYVLKRPEVDRFLKVCCELFEVVIFTASLEEYASPLIDLLDIEKKIPYRLYRDSCTIINNSFVKDLSRLGRDLNHVVIVDNSPTSYSLQPMNAVPIKTWIDDPQDHELNILIHVLEKLSVVNDIPKVLNEIKKRNWTLSAHSVYKLIESEFIPANRGDYNSPVHHNGVKKFKFENA